MEEHSVSVYIYDISNGFAKSMSQTLLGKQLDGIWHTSIVVYGQEFFFGGMGVQTCHPGSTFLGRPNKIEQLGTTQIPYDMFMDYIHELASSSFRPEMYHLLNHNCNTFSCEVAQFLTGRSIPAYITDLPQEFLNTPLGAMVKPFIDAMSVSPSGGTPIDAKPGSACNDSGHREAGCNEPTDSEGKDEAGTSLKSPKFEQCSGKQNSENISTISYKEMELVKKEYSDINDILSSSLQSRDVELLNEILDYITAAEPSWSLCSNHIGVVEKVLQGCAFGETEKKAVCGLLQECLYHDDIIMMLRHDTNGTYTRILSSFEEHSSSVRERLAKGLCNCSSTEKGYEWLMNEPNMAGNGIGEMAVDVCRHCLLDTNLILNTIGAALCCNLTHKNVTTDLAVNLGCALVEMLRKERDTETAKNGILALCQCIQCNNEVAAIAVVSGLDPDVLAKRYPDLRDLCTTRLKLCLSLD